MTKETDPKSIPEILAALPETAWTEPGINSIRKGNDCEIEFMGAALAGGELPGYTKQRALTFLILIALKGLSL